MLSSAVAPCGAIHTPTPFNYPDYNYCRTFLTVSLATDPGTVRSSPFLPADRLSIRLAVKNGETHFPFFFSHSSSVAYAPQRRPRRRDGDSVRYFVPEDPRTRDAAVVGCVKETHDRWFARTRRGSDSDRNPIIRCSSYGGERCAEKDPLESDGERYTWGGTHSFLSFIHTYVISK